MEPAAVNDALFNHLVLPAQLPQRQEHDRQLRLVEGALLERLIGAATIMSGGEADNPSHGHWQSLRQTLIACQHVNRAGRIDKSSLVRRFQNLDPSGCLILHVESQNAGLIVRRAQDPIFKDCVVFEAFEASPRNEDVLAAKAALVWDFPGIAVAVPYTTFSDDDFQTSVASFIEQASLENTKTFAAHTFKAGAIVYEYRNTGDPSIITSMLMAILEENGRRIAPTLLRKRVRDDVCWNRAEKPWRRLPLWLVIRVGIQRYLSMALDAESGRLEYKFYIAVVLSKFLDEAPSYNIGIERVHFLKKKICRRLVKLDLDKQRCVNDSIVSRYGFLFDFLGPKFNKSIENCNRVLNVALAQERASLHKHIPLLPRKAADADLRLSLRISRAHLHNALERFKMPRYRRRQQTRPNEGLAEAAKDHLSHYAQSYHKLIDRELELSHLPGETCSEIAKRITDYANMAVPLYEGNPEQKSQMILTIMEMWQRMDAIACHWFPLLQEFHPVLHPQMLDVLLLPQYTDMARLNTLQLLLSDRVKRANSERRNIFEDPSPGCFGERYYSESADAYNLKQLHESIVEVADDLRASKESEWKKKSQRYDDLIRQIDTSVCSYLRDDFDLLGREQHDPNCPRCSKMWSAQKMRIAIFEDLLPSDPVVTRATVFELACPKEFAVYRETTWWILRQLAAPFNDEGNPPRCLLKDNLQLKPFFEPNRSKVGLASTTKPFITTHYTEVTLLVVSNLVCQSGPADDDGISGNDTGGERGRDVLRKVHKIFREEQFCDRLVEQLIIRLDSLEANWRETYLMDVVITILLRTHTLTATNPNASLKALSALIRARQICLRWVEMLRAETYKESDTEAARRCQQYALWAAILCKRTFVIHRSQATLLDELSLQAYIECCITVQDNLVVEVGALPQVLQHAVVSDLKLSYRLASLVCASIIQSPDVFRLAIRAVWPEPEDRPRQIYNLCSQQPSWVACDIQENEEGNLVQVHYNYVQGLLLVDNKPLGKLPKAPEHIEVLNELFGDQALLTFPSTQKGMDYTLCLTPRNYRVDVGFEAGNMIVRATKGNQYLQLIPREVFRTETSWDLPGPLLDDCWHWLDLKSGKVFITHTTDIWNIHLRNWTLDVHRGVCQRFRGSAGYDKIVDTYSPLFNRVGRIFDGFEHKGQILVYQPASRHLEVEIRRLQLLFYVNPRQVLQSPQLGSEIDLDQDAGTWYGLGSKLVFRNPRDPSQRSILVPVGPFEARRIEGKDIMIARTHPTDMYGRFNINKSLGRLDCAAEPMLLYMKALLHAYTSSVFPDPLTGRTGTEEALQWLSSGVCQPWQVLGSAHVNLLAKIAHLSPRHEYYPEDLRVMKTDMWDDSATESIQHERFRPLVERILSVSDELHTFSLLTSETSLAALPAPGDDHLRHRAESRRQAFERCFDDRTEPIGISDQRYRSRDCPLPSNTRHCQTLEIAHLIRTWPEQLSTTSSLSIQLSMGSSVGGFREAYDRVSLTDRLGVDVLENWGSLVKACREQQSPFALMFVVAPIAFSFKVDMCLIKTLAAFAIFDELKVIELPMWEKYENFKPNQLPQLEQLMRIIALHKMPPPKDDGEELQQFASAKQLRKMREQRDAWERRSDEDCKYLANFLLAQWPCEEPGVAELAKSLLIDVGAALKLVRVEWKRLYQNMDLSIHLDAVQNVLDRRQSEVEYEAPVFIASEELFEERLRGGEILRLRTDLLQKTFPALQSIDPESRKPSNQPAKLATKTTPAANEARHPAHIRKPITLPSSNVRSTGTNVLAPSWMSSKTALIPSSDSTAELKQMVASFSKSPSMVRQKYGEDLQRSLDAFVTRKQPKESTNHEPTAFVAREASLSLMSIQRRFEKIQQALEKPDDTHSSQQLFWLKAGQLWPAITHVTLLEQLRSTAQPITFGKYAKETLIDFGLAITNTQRDLRINDFPCDHPDWLLLEIEANLLIRPDQVDVALATISPASGNNSVLQMNMGQDVEEELIRGLTADVLRGTDGILPVQSLEAADRLAIREFLTGKPRDVTLQRIRQLCPDRPAVRQTVYLLRGILANRILMMTLKKRWNVQYGLHPLRDPIAVPYHAKGVPSEQSEWGHPDVAILFTCLAFYYDGISVSQLTQSLEHLLKSDDPSAEYDKWTQTTESFPESLKAWNSINVDDDLQLVEIWKAVRYNMTTIDYFMNNFVFPQHAKQFRVKLQSNGWDIPLFTVDTPSSNNGDSQEISRALTTGFSGTNDNRTMLPLTIKQEDLPGLSHTNAEVLTYLLHKRSRECRKIEGSGGERATESDLLQELRRRDINILIDAGAQILEMDNVTLAKKWLEVDQRAFAALFFDEQNKPWVIQRTGRKTPLLASPYADDLSRCLVYLDEAHTRGTDLKFPPSARGALTLGLGQSKDHTVQAAMRLRQLGTTQSVTFFAPPEVYQSILDLQSKPLGATVDSHDVICWLLDNTCDGIEQLQPLYYAQGIDFCRRMQATVEHPEFLRDKAQREDYLATIKQNEQFSLQQMYEPKRKVKGTGEFRAGSNLKIRSFVKELNTRRKAFQDTGRAVHASALQEVEQEREVAFEVETVRQVKKPQHYPALSFPGLAQDIESFALNGRIPAGSQSFVPVLKSLAKTGTGKKFKVADRSTQARLFVSTEFERTIKLTFDLTNDNFLRNVNWILWSDVTGVALVVVPEEAEMLLPLIRNKGPKHMTHLILYSAPVTRKMLHFGKLDYLSIPPLANDWEAPMWLRVELGLYAGRLYFEWDEYAEICRLLGIDETSLSEDMEESSDEDLERAQLDGAVESKPSSKPAKTGLTPRPLTFCQEWLAARRRGQDFVSTPMGFIAQGKPLQTTHPFFRKTDTEKNDKLFVPISRQKVQQDADDQPLDDFGLDYMGENENADSDADDDEIEYNESEMGSDGEDPQVESDSEY
ncbi:hypothetical protein KNSL1_008961 [Colletotrichum chrysophilum]|nr:hypothetical protein KNSL1_008961 [Colletotrichum chrysophilum]